MPDHSVEGIEKRVLERESDRRKENIMEAERWNERGGLQLGSHRRVRSTGPPPPFAVFVDEECAAQHQKDVENRRIQTERQRKERDERTFRERKEEGMVREVSNHSFLAHFLESNFASTFLFCRRRN